MQKIYILMSRDQTMFKIGISIDTVRRARSLPDDVNLAESFEASLGDGSAREAERMLHYVFRSSRLTRPSGQGRTEWFNVVALGEVIAYINANADALGVSSFGRIALPEQRSIEKRCNDKPQSVPAREQRRLDRAAAERSLCEKRNAEEVKRLELLMDEMEWAGVMIMLNKPDEAGVRVRLSGQNLSDWQSRIMASGSLRFPGGAVHTICAISHILSDSREDECFIHLAEELFSDPPFPECDPIVAPAATAMRDVFLSAPGGAPARMSIM